MADGFAADLRAATSGSWNAAVGAASSASCGPARSTTGPGARMALARQLGAIAGDEDDYFDRALARLRVDPADVERSAECRR